MWSVKTSVTPIAPFVLVLKIESSSHVKLFPIFPIVVIYLFYQTIHDISLVFISCRNLLHDNNFPLVPSDDDPTVVKSFSLPHCVLLMDPFPSCETKEKSSIYRKLKIRPLQPLPIVCSVYLV